MKTAKPLSNTLAAFVAETRIDAIPDDVRRWGKLLMLDAIGNAYASTRFDFARKALSALRGLDPGQFCVIGMPERLALREAVIMNGVLVHGLDYDDSYLPGAAHMTGSCVPAALAMADRMQASGEEMLSAYLLGMEAGVRLGAASKGSFVKAGFHPTSLLGTFAASLIAGRLMRMSQPQLVLAQGMALSFASGTLQPTQEGTWAKRMHAGWAGAAGVLAASLAREGFTAPAEAYEGRYGLFACFLGAHAADADLELATRDIGDKWELARTSIKLYPACYQSHAFMNAAIELKKEEPIDVAQIESIRTRVAEAAVPLICEPMEAKLKPKNSYAAQFSLPYALACCLARGRFGLDETEESAYTDSGLLALAQKVSYSIDPDSGFPKYRSGEVIIRMKGGRQYSRRKNLYPDDKVGEETVIAKFMDNTKLALAPSQAGKIADMIMNAERMVDVRILARALGRSREDLC